MIAENDVQDIYGRINDRPRDVKFSDSPFNESDIQAVMIKIGGSASTRPFSLSTNAMKIYCQNESSRDLLAKVFCDFIKQQQIRQSG